MAILQDVKGNIDLQGEPMMSKNSLDDDIFINKKCFLQRFLIIKSQLLREFLAEFFGTFLLMVFINGACAQNTLFTRDDPRTNNHLAIDVTCGFGVTIAILVTGKVSGAHINPAVSLSMLILGKLSIIRFIVYVIAQLLGAFFGAFAVYLNYFEHLAKFEPAFDLNTAGIFATYPAAGLSYTGAMYDQVLGTALLIIVVLAVTDKENENHPHGAIAVFLGLTVMIIGTAFGYNCGYAINPARDFSPRLFTFLAGWGVKVFTTGNYYFLIPIYGPLIGSVIGTIIYYVLIGNHWADKNQGAFYEIRV